MLEAINLGREDQGQWRVQDLSLCLSSGHALGLLGLNGAGKSTALALLSGALAPSSGQALLNGQDIHRHPQAKRAMGLLPEKPPLYPSLTVAEHLTLSARLHLAQPTPDQLNSTLEQCGLAGLEHRLAYKLSRGMAQRLALAMALIHQPQVLILDEPTAGLDPAQAAEFRQLIKSRLQQSALIIASHIFADIEQLCDSALVLAQGRALKTVDLHQTNHVRIQLTHPPSISRISALLGQGKVTALDDGWFMLKAEKAPENLAELIAGQGWGLRAFVPERLDWQSTFEDLAP